MSGIPRCSNFKMTLLPLIRCLDLFDIECFALLLVGWAPVNYKIDNYPLVRNSSWLVTSR